MKYSKEQQLSRNDSRKGREAEDKTGRELKRKNIKSRPTIASGAVFGDADRSIGNIMLEEKTSPNLAIRTAYRKLKKEASTRFPTPPICLKFLIDDEPVVLIPWEDYTDNLPKI